MLNGFHRASLSISLDFDFEQWSAGVRMINGRMEPAETRDPRAQNVQRVYWHEKFHFYQLFSQGYLTRLALLEWRNLEEFEKTGEAKVPEDLARYRADFFRVDPDLGFSAWNLSEALARFWDILVIGFDVAKKDGRMPKLPPQVRGVRRVRPRQAPSLLLSDIEFDFLMQLEDWYAKPYRLLLRHFTSRQAVLLFPLVGHFALQSATPVAVFRRSIERLYSDAHLFAQLGTLTGELFMLPVGPWDSLSMALPWLAAAPRVQFICEEAAKEVTDGSGLEPGWDVI